MFSFPFIEIRKTIELLLCAWENIFLVLGMVDEIWDGNQKDLSRIGVKCDSYPLKCTGICIFLHFRFKYPFNVQIVSLLEIYLITSLTAVLNVH